jgi:hypothetical protein
MEPINDLTLMEEKVLERAKQLILKVKKVIGDEPVDLTAGIKILADLRKDAYEDLNQIQHEAMILKAARSINSKDFFLEIS